VEERNSVRKQSEGDFHAIVVVIEKLKIHGPALRFPHQSAVRGKGGAGLRELRPTKGGLFGGRCTGGLRIPTSSLPSVPRPRSTRAGSIVPSRMRRARRKAIEDAL
jgi:hypothetical protein